MTPGSPAPASSERVLVVDDDAALRGFVRQVLETEGLGCVEARNVDEGVSAAREPSLGLVLLDMNMPDGTGLQALARIRAEQPARYLPVVFLTSEAGLRVKASSLAQGGDDYLVKPVSPVELIARVRVQLRTKRLYDGLQEANRRLLELDALRQGLGEFIVHDLKNAVAPFKMGLEFLDAALAEVPPATQRAREVVRMCQDGADLLLGLLGDMLDVSRLEQSAFPVHCEPCAPADLLADCRARLLLSAGARSARLEVRAPPSGSVLADRGVVVRVLANLAGNAVKFARRGGGLVELSAEPGPTAEWVFSVRDNGPGIPKGDLDKVFDKFYRVNTLSLAAAPGTGLGLTFCRLAVEAHGGRIWVESEEGKGSLFSFSLRAVP